MIEKIYRCYISSVEMVLMFCVSSAKLIFRLEPGNATAVCSLLCGSVSPLYVFNLNVFFYHCLVVTALSIGLYRSKIRALHFALSTCTLGGRGSGPMVVGGVALPNDLSSNP